MSGMVLLVTALLSLNLVDGAVTVPSCACAAEAFNFDIDCSSLHAQHKMIDAYNSLKTLKCGSTKAICEASKECRKNFYILQAHHMRCFFWELPNEVKHGIHEFESSCPTCTIERQVNPSVKRQCEKPDCSKIASVVAAKVDILTKNNCNSTCSSVSCQEAYDSIFATHDLCSESEVLASAGGGGGMDTGAGGGDGMDHSGHRMLSSVPSLADAIHEWEYPCADTVCNSSGDRSNNTLICDPRFAVDVRDNKSNAHTVRDVSYSTIAMTVACAVFSFVISA